MSNYSFGTCPYNKDHRIMLFRMPGHIVKCMQNYHGPPLYTCKYNAIHRVLDMEEHLKECEDYIKFTENNTFQMAISVRANPFFTDEDAV
ncbi:gametocyte-specific factor 1 [Drosophila obscura]|uniref:gametocyte-specific factor 1 n=1 Tax=Drosophila obscura TaxID=7282 RepID=UPI000BA09AB5|nr:gametocyte-specific factor 1 [Drosophila obscura]